MKMTEKEYKDLIAHFNFLADKADPAYEREVQKVVERLRHMVSPYMVVAFRRRDGAVQPVDIYRKGWGAPCTERKG